MKKVSTPPENKPAVTDKELQEKSSTLTRDQFPELVAEMKRKVLKKLSQKTNKAYDRKEKFVPSKNWKAGHRRHSGCCDGLTSIFSDGELDKTKMHKPKKTRDQKFSSIANAMSRRDSITPQLFHLLDRHFNKEKPGNEFERFVFEGMNNLSEKDLISLQKGLKAFKEIDRGNRSKLFMPAFLDWSIHEAVDSDILHYEMLDQGLSFMGIKGIDHILLPGRPRPWYGQQTGDSNPLAPFPWINEVNLQVNEPYPLRTATHHATVPFYKPEEYQQNCQWEINEETGQTVASCQKAIEPTCDVAGHVDYKSQNAFGKFSCLRVREVRVGNSVTLVGFNFFSRNSQVILTKIDDGTSYEFDGYVIGDKDTPILDDKGMVISDHRVRDMLMFDIPELEPKEGLIDFPPGFYQVVVKVPNDISYTNPDGSQATEFYSNIAYLKVLPKENAAYRVWSDMAHCYDPTDGEWGKDEVYVRAYPAVFDTNLQAPQILPVTGLSWGSVDGGDTESFHWDLVGQPGAPQPINGIMGIGIIGWEVDSEDALNEAILSYDAAFTKFWNIVWIGLTSAAGAIGAIVGAILAFLAKSLWWVALVIVAVALIVTLIVGLIWAAWAPPDRIILDLIMLSELDIYYLTLPPTPVPAPSTNTIIPDIEVQVLPDVNGKYASLYTEERQYTSDDEGSKYGFRLLYQRDI